MNKKNSMKPQILIAATAAAALILAGCSSPPKPPMPSGQRIAVNGQPGKNKPKAGPVVWNFATDTIGNDESNKEPTE